MSQHHDQISELTVPIVIPMEDDLIHTAAHPFCWQDPTCPCHEDSALIFPVEQAYESGLLTPEEAIRTIAGWNL